MQPSNLPEIHLAATILQHAKVIFNTLTCSSNRESTRTVSGGSGLSFLFCSNICGPKTLSSLRATLDSLAYFSTFTPFAQSHVPFDLFAPGLISG